MRAIAAISLSLIAAGQGALAMVPPFPCFVERGTTTLVSDEALTSWEDGSGVYPTPWDNGFVSFDWYDADDSWRAVLQHCPTGNFLLVVAGRSNADTVSARFWDLLESPESYTMRQIGEDLAPMGGGARVGQGEWGNCACDYVGYGG